MCGAGKRKRESVPQPFLIAQLNLIAPGREHQLINGLVHSVMATSHAQGVQIGMSPVFFGRTKTSAAGHQRSEGLRNSRAIANCCMTFFNISVTIKMLESVASWR